MPNISYWRKRYEPRVLILGLFLIGCSIWLAQPTFTSKSSLTELKGNFDTAYLNVITVSSTSGRYIYYTYKSQKATLTFKIKNCDKIFSISENIGDNYFDGNYDGILNGLKESHKVEVWIKKSDTASYTPKVYQIFGDSNPLLTLSSFRNKDLDISTYTFILGLLSLTLWFAGKYPDKFKRIFNFKKTVQ